MSAGAVLVTELFTGAAGPYTAASALIARQQSNNNKMRRQVIEYPPTEDSSCPMQTILRHFTFFVK